MAEAYFAMKPRFDKWRNSYESKCFFAPGRTEIGGNHTDHQHGCVLAAAVNLETVAEVTLNDSQTITPENTTDILQMEVGKVFAQVLKHTGVYKRTADGSAAFDRFIDFVNQEV